MFRKDTQHAMRAMAVLARLDGQSTLMAIAAAANAPVPVLSKILQRLGKHGLIAGRPGPGGGYHLTKPADAIRLEQIVDIFEGSEFGMRCLMGRDGCEAKCPMHAPWVQFSTEIRKYLHQHTVADLTPEGMFVPVLKI